MNEKQEQQIRAWIEGRLSEAEAVELLQACEGDPAVLEAAARHYRTAQMLAAQADAPDFAERIMSALGSLDETEAAHELESRVMRRLEENGKSPARTFRVDGRRLADAETRRRRRRRPLLPRLAAAAVLMLVAGALVWFAFLRLRYPAPTVNGKRSSRGQEFTAQGGGLELQLGGYCRIRLAAGSRARIEGEARDERLHLFAGRAECRVEPGHGGFCVLTELGEVKVQGTEFSVELEQLEPRGDLMKSKRMIVNVVSAVVLVTGITGTRELKAGDSHVVENRGARKQSTRSRQATAREDGKKPDKDLKGIIKIAGPEPIDKPKAKWRGRGRVVGRIKNAKLSVLSVRDFRTGKHIAGAEIVESDEEFVDFKIAWLKPGVYRFVIEAEGYETLTVRHLKIPANTDMWYEIEFVPASEREEKKDR